MFSIIVFFSDNKSEKNLEKFFLRLQDLVNKIKDVELIFIINNNDYEIIDLIEKFSKQSKNIIVKFIFSSKTPTFNKTLVNVLDIITNEYTLFVSDNTVIDVDFFKKANKILEKNNVDILEVRPHISGVIKWNPSQRQLNENLDKVIKINENPSVVAFSFPFLFNKFISNNLLTKTAKLFSKETDASDYSSFIFSKFVYLLFVNATTYFYSKDLTLNISLVDEVVLNFNDVISTWNKVQIIFTNEGKLSHEIKYAKLFYLKIMLCSIYSLQSGKKIRQIIANRNNLIQQRYYDKLNYILDKEFKNFNLENKYMILNNTKENQILKENYSISKWNKLLKELEA